MIEAVKSEDHFWSPLTMTDACRTYHKHIILCCMYCLALNTCYESNQKNSGGGLWTLDALSEFPR